MSRKLERYTVLLLLLASPLWLPAVPPSWGAQLRISLHQSLEPILHALGSLREGSRDLFLGYLKAPFLEKENRYLKVQIDTLLAHEAVHQRLQKENIRLRRLLDFKEKAPWNILPAQVIGREFSLWSRTLWIDRGTEDGLRVGQAVITPVGLVGRITQSGRSVSRVILLTDPHFRVAATTGDSRIPGLVTGSSSGEVLLTYLPKEVPIQPKEQVFTSGGRSFSPEGIPIGQIDRIQEDPGGIFRFGTIQPKADFFRSEELLVLRSADE